jgi:hypothetical protein
MTTRSVEDKEGLDVAAAEAEEIRATERERLRSLLEKDVERARQLHADDFQLITPDGATLSKDQYLGAIACGELDYVVFGVDSPIDVRLHGEAAIIRYRSTIEVVFQMQRMPLHGFWHTDVYEKRSGRWRAVWSQATRIQKLEHR